MTGQKLTFQTGRQSRHLLLRTSALQAAVEPALGRVQQLARRLPQLAVAAGQVEGGHGGGAELVQQRLQEAGGIRAAAAQPVALLQGGQGLSRRAEEAVGDVGDGVESHTCGGKHTTQATVKSNLNLM